MVEKLHFYGVLAALSFEISYTFDSGRKWKWICRNVWYSQLLHRPPLVGRAMLQNESYVTKAAAGKGDVCCVDSFRQELVGSQSRFLLGEDFLPVEWIRDRGEGTGMPSHGACPCSLSPTHPSVLEMNVAIASSKVTMASLAQANTTVSYATSPTRERRRTVSPSRSSSATRTTTASPPSSSHRTTLERLRASPGANLLAGGIGGLASLVVGHPFDTVKVGKFIIYVANNNDNDISWSWPVFQVRLQTMSADNRGKIPYRSATHCLSKMVEKRYTMNNIHAWLPELNTGFQVQREGPSSLFRGMSGLAVFSVPRFALLFYANSWGRLILPPGEGVGPSLSQVCALKG